MENVLDYSVEFLKVHPRNSEFYDDIAGEDYEQFKASIENEGVLTPLIVAPDMTVISGHQRLKACRDLGIDMVPVIIRQDIRTEEEKMVVLLATNFGRPDSAKKKRKIADEYVKLRGKGHGGSHEKARANNRLSLDEIAKQLGISKSALKDILAIERKLTPEIKEMLDAGLFTETTAAKILVKLTSDEQKELIATYGQDIIEGASQKQIQEFVERLELCEKEKAKAIEKVKAEYEQKIEDVKNTPENFDYLKAVDELEKNKQKLREEYERNQKYRKEIEEEQIAKNKVLDSYNKVQAELVGLKLELEMEQARSNSLVETGISNDSNESYYAEFEQNCKRFLNGINYGVFSSDSCKTIDKAEKDMYIKLIENVTVSLSRIKENLMEE